MNTGKQFEQMFKKSIPNDIMIFRIPDAAQAFGGGQLRFSRKNPFDYFLFDTACGVLYALELKTVAGKSISFERSTEDRGDIHLHQIHGLLEYSQYDRMICGFIIEFRSVETTVFIDIGGFLAFTEKTDKKSVSVSDIGRGEADAILIPQRKLKTNYRYNVMPLLGHYREIQKSR